MKDSRTVEEEYEKRAVDYLGLLITAAIVLQLWHPLLPSRQQAWYDSGATMDTGSAATDRGLTVGESFRPPIMLLPSR